MRIGTVIDGRYRVLRRLGGGGEGELVVAWDERDEREVAVKLQHPRTFESTTYYNLRGAALIKEAETGQSLSGIHGIPEVYGHGLHFDRRYAAMKLIDGVVLSELIKNNRPLVSFVAASVIDQLCMILDAVHTRNLVHRDVKPDNIMVKWNGEVQLLDLGIAAKAGVDVTSVGGTAGYAPPEQYMGEMVTAQTDIYALGCLLFEMIAMYLPFTEDENWNVREREHPVPPNLIAQVPPSLRDLAVSMVSREPADRPSSVREVRDRLAPVLPTPDSLPDAQAPRPDPTAPYRKQPRTTNSQVPSSTSP